MKRQGIRTISQKVITKKEMAPKVESISLYILYLCLLLPTDSYNDPTTSQISVELNKFL